MKTQEEVKQLADDYSEVSFNKRDLYEGYVDGYTQCQQDFMELLESEIRRAFIHGKSNGKNIEAGLEINMTEDYTNWRMKILNK
jgi:hypothetical protein